MPARIDPKASVFTLINTFHTSPTTSRRSALVLLTVPAALYALPDARVERTG